MDNTSNKPEKLQWVVKHQGDFKQEVDFLNTVLTTCGVEEDQIEDFLKPRKKHLNDPFLMKNMDKAVELVHKHIKKKSGILVKVDCDTDGFCATSILIQFLRELNSNADIEYKISMDKKHGLFMSDFNEYQKDEFGLIIVPDASMTVSDAKQITKNINADILILDHHLQEKEFFNKETSQEINRIEAKELWNKDKDALIADSYTNYCLAVNCTDGQYPNPSLCGAGVVQKFIEAYIQTYGEEDDIPEELLTEYYDLVSLANIADSMDLRSLETRYYVLEGLKQTQYRNEFINELVDRNADDMKWGRTIISMAWTIAPKINGCVRYGSEDEQIEMFRAFLGEQEDIEYQPRRKKASDPKPDIEIHTLQWDAARICGNIKSRQDTEVRKFVQDLTSKIEEQKLDQNSVIFVDGTKVLTKGTVTGLVANRLASKYFRPVVLMRSKDATDFGGSGRGYDKGVVKNFNEFLSEAGVECKGHAGAFGISFPKAKLDDIIAKCNEMLPIDQLVTIHTVDWEIPANKLKREYVQEVAENYAVFGSTVPEPIFAISNMKINASNIKAYGENNGFIRFVYNGVTFIKKYCAHDDFDKLTLKDRKVLGVNKKDLNVNIIGKFQLEKYEDKIYPEVRIEFFDSEDITGLENIDDAEEFGISEAPKKNSKPKQANKVDEESFEDIEEEMMKPKKKVDEVLDESFDW